MKNASLKIYTQYLALGFVATLLLFRIYELGKDFERRQNSIYDQRVASVAKELKNKPDAICTNLNGRVALSNLHLVYRMVCAAPVREMFLSFEHNKFIDESLKSWADLGTKRGIIVSLFPIGKDSDNLPLKQEYLTRLNSLGWQVERNEKENLIISHKEVPL